MTTDFQPWIPDALRIGIIMHMRLREKFGYSVGGEGLFPPEISDRLLNDSRLMPFWRWVDTTGIPAMVEDHKTRSLGEILPAGVPKESDEDIARLKVHVMYWGIGECFNEPDKVDSMIASERREYFSEVSSAATKLIGLLKGTQFDAGMWDGATWYDLERAQNLIKIDLHACEQQVPRQIPWRTFFYDDEDEDGVGIWSMAPDYPLHCLTDQLEKLRKWSSAPESLNERFSPYTPVKQRGTRGLKNRVLLNLARKFRFSEWGWVTIPYEHLAELVNAGLDLPEDEQLNKTSARKQIERYAKERDKS